MTNGGHFFMNWASQAGKTEGFEHHLLVLGICIALMLRGGTLWVTASSTPLAHQLHLERRSLIDRLNAMIGAPVVRDIRFRQTGPSR